MSIKGERLLSGSQAGGSPKTKSQTNSFGGFAMSAIRKIVLSAATLFLGLSGLFFVTAPANADNDWTTVDNRFGNSIQCDNDWTTPEPTPC
jgi:hypothetical protein